MILELVASRLQLWFVSSLGWTKLRGIMSERAQLQWCNVSLLMIPKLVEFDLHGSTEQVYCEQHISFDFIELEQNWAFLKVKMLNMKKQKTAYFRFLVTNGNPKSKLGSKRKRE